MSVIVCAYTLDRWNALGDAVASVRAQTMPVDEILVVIDHNGALHDRASAAFAAYGRVKVIENGGERGLSGARNTGVTASRGSIVAFLDDDAVAAPDWIERLVAGYVDDHVLGVGGRIVPVWPEARPVFMPAEFDWVVGCTYRGIPHHTGSVRNLIGANMSFRRHVFDRAGLFSSAVGRIGARPMGCEETELCLRAAVVFPEGRFVYEPAARVDHVVEVRRTTWTYFSSRCYAEGLSKATVALSAGSGAALDTERRYVLRTLPSGIARGFADACRGRVGGLFRGAAIVVGLFLTVLGYVIGTAQSARSASRRRVVARGPASIT